MNCKTKIKLSALAILFIALVSCQETKQTELKLETKKDSASYGIGVQYATEILNNIKSSDIETELNYEALIAGFANVMDQKDVKLNIETASKVAREYITGLMAIRSAQKESENLSTYADVKTQGENFLAENAKKQGVTVTSSGLQYEVIKKGNGDIPTPADRVKVHYTGTLLDGTVFDTSTKQEPVVFGVTGVIAGWTEALQLMPVGSKWKLYIPQNLAYGGQSVGNDIKPYSTLIFEVELLGIEKKQ